MYKTKKCTTKRHKTKRLKPMIEKEDDELITIIINNIKIQTDKNSVKAIIGELIK